MYFGFVLTYAIIVKEGRKEKFNSRLYNYSLANQGS